MRRSKESELASLHRAVMRSRMLACEARNQLIEALGDWLCGGEAGPPSADEVALLAHLYQAQSEAEATYVRCVVAMAEDVCTRARQRQRQRS